MLYEACKLDSRTHAALTVACKMLGIPRWVAMQDAVARWVEGPPREGAGTDELATEQRRAARQLGRERPSVRVQFKLPNAVSRGFRERREREKQVKAAALREAIEQWVAWMLPRLGRAQEGLEAVEAPKPLPVSEEELREDATSERSRFDLKWRVAKALGEQHVAPTRRKRYRRPYWKREATDEG